MHRGRVVLGTVVGAALAVAVATQVSSWSPDATGWDGYGPTGPTIEPTPEPIPADYTSPPECQEAWEAALRDGRVREAQQAGASAIAVACHSSRSEDCTPGYVEWQGDDGRAREYIWQSCEAAVPAHAVVQVPEEQAPPTVPSQPLPSGHELPPGCADEYEAARRTAEEAGSAMVAVPCERGEPATDRPTVDWTPPAE